MTLTLLYLITVVGFALNLHYCFNHITAVNINTPVKDCGMLARKMKCCHDKHFEVKVNDAHQAKAASLLSAIQGFKLPKISCSSDLFLQHATVINSGINHYHPDPPPDNITNCIKNCVFRI